MCFALQKPPQSELGTFTTLGMAATNFELFAPPTEDDQNQET